MTKNGQPTEKGRVNYVELLEKMQCTLEVAEAAEPEARGGSLLGGVPYIQGLSDEFPYLGAFLAAHVIGPPEGPQGSSMLWVTEEGLTFMVYIRDSDIKAFFNGESLQGVLSDANEFLALDPIPWRATRKTRQKASKKAKTTTSKPR